MSGFRSGFRPRSRRPGGRPAEASDRRASFHRLRLTLFFFGVVK